MIRFTYVPDWRWLVLGGAALVLLFFWSYRTARGGRVGGLKRLLLLGLRLSTMSLVLVFLLDPHRVEAIRHQQKARVAVLLDASRSMSLQDLPGGRLSAAKSWLKEKLAPALPPNLEVSYYAFSDSLAPLADLDRASPTGGVTAMTGALESLLAAPQAEQLTGVILCSDGIENAGKNAARIARSYRRKGIPIHTVTFGTTNEPQDISLENVQVKRATPNEAPTRIAVTIQSSGYAGQTVPLLIQHENEVVAQKRVTLAGGSQRVEVDFTPRQRGFLVYEVIVPPQVGEWRAGNNRRLFGLEVTVPSIQVLYMEGTPQEGSQPEWEYLQDALETDPNIKVTVLNQDLWPSAKMEASARTGARIFPVNHPTRGFPRTLGGLLAYDVIINSDIRKQFFTEEQLQNTVRLVEEYGGGFVMIGGFCAFGSGGYQRTIIDRIVPVAMEQLTDYTQFPFHLRITAETLGHPITALGATREETEMIWTQKFPILFGHNRVDRAKPGAVVLGEDPSPAAAAGANVVLAAQELGRGRTMAFTSDTTRGWGANFETLWGEPIVPSQPLSERNCDSRYYRQFWVNAIRWLAAGRMNRTNSPLTLELARGYCLPGQTVAASVKLRSQEIQEAGAPEVSLVISNASQSTPATTARYDETGRSYLAEIRPPAAGDYTVWATALLNGKKSAEDRQLLVCEAADLEVAEPRTNPEFMATIARVSGGRILPPDAGSADSLSSAFDRSMPVIVEYRRHPLWDKSAWLALILGLLTVDWVARRWRGFA